MPEDDNDKPDLAGYTYHSKTPPAARLKRIRQTVGVSLVVGFLVFMFGPFAPGHIKGLVLVGLANLAGLIRIREACSAHRRRQELKTLRGAARRERTLRKLARR